MNNVEQLPVKATSERPAPRRIMHPCELGLLGTVHDLETQMGTVEAYNGLCDAARRLKAKIDAGDAEQPHKMWVTDPKFTYAAGGAAVTLPSLPEIPRAMLRPTKRPYKGAIGVGDVFAWEPDLPHARELCVVTRITGPLEPEAITHSRGTAVLFRGSETTILTRPLGGGKEVWNDESRFREAVVLTIFRPMAAPSANEKDST